MNTASLIESVTNHFPDAAPASHTYRGDATVVLRRKFLLDVARSGGAVPFSDHAP